MLEKRVGDCFLLSPKGYTPTLILLKPPYISAFICVDLRLNNSSSFGSIRGSIKRRSARDTKGVFVNLACFAVYSMMRVPFMTLQWPGKVQR